MSKKIARYLSVLLVVSVLFSSISLQLTTAFAETSDESVTTSADVTITPSSDLIDYTEYSKNGGGNKATEDLSVAITPENLGDAVLTVVEDGAVNWATGEGSATWSFDVPTDARYNLEIVWEAQSSGTDIELGVMIDGGYLFEEAETIILKRIWKNASDEPRTDALGNQYAQEQVEIDGYVESVIRDYEGAVIDPFEFSLTAGAHTITLVAPDQNINIKSISFIAPEDVKSYKEVSASYKLNNLKADNIIIEGEAADRKNSNSIIPKSNNSDAGMSPHDSFKTKLNYIGSTAWKTAGSTVEWDFNVEKSGYYYINLRYKQSDLVNGESWRWLKIDGKTPFEEAKEMVFPYGTSWEYYTFGEDEDNPYYIYLEEGPHTLSMEVTVGAQSEYFYELAQLVDILGDEYIKIVKITGESPDPNRDYEFQKQIPDFNKTLTVAHNRLAALVEKMTKASGNASQAAAAIKNMNRVLENMTGDSAYLAQQYVSDYYSNYTTISSWLYDMIAMPLSIDQIQIVPAGNEYIDNDANFFVQLGYDTTRLISSFTNDYSLNSKEALKDENTIRLWVGWGQDQVAVLNSLIKDSFTSNPDYYYNGKPINVQVEIVNASLINGILAGNYPDMSLQMARTEPVNMGIRGALADLSEMEGFEETLERFQTGAVVPYTYNGKTYALPDSQNYMLMFYRTDVLEELGLEVPNTWEEFLYCATIIQRNNMNVYVPYTQIVATGTVNAGIGSLHLYPTLLSQHNLSIYNEQGTATAITSKEALDVFDMWTGFYKEYSFLKESDFYNRLRVGVMPLGIAPYTTYNTIYASAPEIRGRWSIAMVPGTENEDGTINRTIAGSGSGCAIVKKSTKKEQAWKFLQWWTSAETQSRYNNNLESILGTIGRTAVSNVDAFKRLAWDSEHLEILLDQWSQVKEVPEVPGSYDVTRSIDQAYWEVIEDGAKVKDAVTKWSKTADLEIARKIEEYK